MIDIECSVFIYSSGTGLEKKKNRKNRKQWESDLWPNIIFGDWTLVGKQDCLGWALGV